MTALPLFHPTDCPPRLAYSIKEAAEVSGLGRTTIYSLISEGRLEAVKVRSRTLIPRPSLEAVLRGAPLQTFPSTPLAVLPDIESYAAEVTAYPPQTARLENSEEQGR